MADEWDLPSPAAVGPALAVDPDDQVPDEPWFLKKGAKQPVADEWDAPAAKPDASRKIKNTGPDVAGQLASEAATLQRQAPRGLAERARDSVAGIANTVRGGARAVTGALDRGVLTTLEDPVHRRQFERGLSDIITLGYAEKLGNKLDPEFAATAQSDQEAAPDDRALGQVFGMASPGVGTYAAKSAGKVLAPVLSDIQGTTLAGRAAVGAAKGVAGYEATAPLTAGLSASAEGHRLETARDAAIDPVGLATSAVGGAVTEPAAKNLVENARSRATKDIAHDIIAAEGPKARDTDRMRIADINDRLFQATKDMPELRDVWRMPAEKALPEVAKVKQAIARPLDQMTDAVDQATGGGIRLGDIVDGYRERAKELGKARGTIEDADRLNRLADQEVRAAANRQAGRPPIFDPAAKIDEAGTTAGQQVQMLEKSQALAARTGQADAAQQIAGEIERVKAAASKPAPLDMDERIPTKDFRANVTSLHKTANDVMGSIEGTPRHEAAQRLYQEAKDIIDQHLDASGVDPKMLAEMRLINDRYFLLSQAESAIASRGVKEANRPALEQLIHSPRRALAAGGAVPVIAATMMSHNPLKVAAELGTGYAVAHALPAVASRVNWRLANIDPARAGEVAANAGATVGEQVGRTAGPEIARQASDRAIAQLVQGASAGEDPAELQKRAAAWGIDPTYAASVIAKFAPAAAQGAP